jgi:phosphatidylinositol alpha-1,6-mannosyltransferase
MKILYLTPGCFDKGGISRYNRYQIRVCRELFGESQIKVFSLLGPSDNDFEEPMQVEWHGNGANMKSKAAMMRRVIRCAMQWKPDLILCAHVNLSGLGYFVSRFHKTKTILNAYGLEIWSPLSRDASWGLKNTGMIISDCHNTADWLIQNRNRKAETIRVVWDCIDVNTLKPSEVSDNTIRKYNLPDPKKYFNILTLGRLSLPDAKYKGYDRLLDVFFSLAPEYQNLRLIIAGRGNYTERLKERVKLEGMEEKVSFTGSVEETDMAEVYNACSIFSLITDSGEGKGEGIPLTPLEAMACGKPILVGNQDGSREAIINENGFAMNPFDLEAHKTAILNYAENAGVLMAHSKNALSVAHSYFAYEHFKLKHQQILGELNKN